MSLEQAVRQLSRIPLLAQLEPEALRLLAFSAETLTLASGDVLFRQGDISDAGYVVLAGTIIVETPDACGTNRHVGPDSLLGETALLVATQRPVTAQAQGTTKVLKIPRILFQRVLQVFPDGAVRLHSFLARRLAGYASELDDMRQRVLAEPTGHRTANI